jgi:hypothetical protein
MKKKKSKAFARTSPLLSLTSQESISVLRQAKEYRELIELRIHL